MIFFISNLIISFIIFLFCLYLLARDDFILLRKNITLEEVFNYAFIAGGIGLLTARIFYVLFHPSMQYLNPLVFLVFIYFPGLSLLGCFVGVGIYLFFLSQRKKLPRGRTYDIFSLSFLTAWSTNLLLSFLLTVFPHKHIQWAQLVLSILVFAFFLVARLIFHKNRAKDGIIAIVTVLVFSIGSLLQQILNLGFKKNFLLNTEVIATAILLFIGILLLIKQKLLRKRRS